MSSVKKILIAAGAAVALCSPTLCSAVTVSCGSSDGLIVQLSQSLGSPLPQVSPNAADAALWNLVSAARSQDRAMAATTLTPLAFAPAATPSPQPLSGVTWLFVLGVLGLAGSRLTTLRGDSPGRQATNTSASTDPGLATSGYSAPW